MKKKMEANHTIRATINRILYTEVGSTEARPLVGALKMPEKSAPYSQLLVLDLEQGASSISQEQHPPAEAIQRERDSTGFNVFLDLPFI